MGELTTDTLKSLQKDRNGRRLNDRKNNRPVSGPLRNLFAALFPLLRQFLEVRDDRLEQL